MRITTSMQKKAKIAQKEAKEANKVEKNVKVENGNENESTEMVKKEKEST